MTVLALTRILRHTARLESARAFYRDALGYEDLAPPAEDAALASLLGVSRVVMLRMKLGAQELALFEAEPSVKPFPRKLGGNDLRFQHIAIVTTDISAAHQRVIDYGGEPLSHGGPVVLPPGSGGVTAFKFYDPEGHPLELLQFPGSRGGQGLFTGFDHSAITVSNVARSVDFYERLGLKETSRQINRGQAQDALDALTDTSADVLALSTLLATPHVELLHYRRPEAAPVTWQPRDIRADRLVFTTSEPGLNLARDPDGHEHILVESRFASP